MAMAAGCASSRSPSAFDLRQASRPEPALAPRASDAASGSSAEAPHDIDPLMARRPSVRM